MQIYEYSILEVVILVRNLLDHCRILGLDILAEQSRGGVPVPLSRIGFFFLVGAVYCLLKDIE